jgi:ribosomal protein S17E
MAAANTVDPIKRAEQALATAEQNLKTVAEAANAQNQEAVRRMNTRREVAQQLSANRIESGASDPSVAETAARVAAKNADDLSCKIHAEGCAAARDANEKVQAAKKVLRELLMMKMQHKQKLKAQEQQLTAQFEAQKRVLEECISTLQRQIDNYAAEKNEALKTQEQQLTAQFEAQKRVLEECIAELQRQIDNRAAEDKRAKEKECDDKFAAKIAALQARITSLE